MIQHEIQQNEAIIKAIRDKIGTTTGGAWVQTNIQDIVPDEEGGYGWLNQAVRSIVPTFKENLFHAGMVHAEIKKRYPDKNVVKTSIYGVFRKLIEAGLMVEVIRGRGRKSSFYKNVIPEPPQ